MTTDHLYTERVGAGEPGFDAHLARYAWACESMPRGARVLDAGCGVGFGAALLEAAGMTVVAVDADEEAVEQARAATSSVEVLDADVLALPFEDGSFDAVTCFEVIEHVHEPERLVAELARVLRPGGTLTLSTPNARMERLHERARGRGPNPHHVVALTPSRVRRLLAASFRDVQLLGQTEDRGALHAALQGLDPLGLRLRLAPARRETVRGALAAAAPAGATRRFRFSRLLAHSAAITVAHATRR